LMAKGSLKWSDRFWMGPLPVTMAWMKNPSMENMACTAHAYMSQRWLLISMQMKELSICSHRPATYRVHRAQNLNIIENMACTAQHKHS